MNIVFQSFAEAINHANAEAFATGVRQRVFRSQVLSLWYVKPVLRFRPVWDDWPEKVEISKLARTSARKIRKGRPVSFKTAPGIGSRTEGESDYVPIC